MATWIALFRGINVGGKNTLPMSDLKDDLESLKFKNVRTYIQSGNVVFESTSKSAAALSKKIAQQIEERRGIHTDVLVLQRRELETAIESNPFPKAVTDPKSLHFFFLLEPANAPDTDAIEKSRASTERYKLIDKVFFLHAPDGIGRSKLAANLGKHLGVTTTARNYRTLDQLMSMAKRDDS